VNAEVCNPSSCLNYSSLHRKDALGWISRRRRVTLHITAPNQLREVVAWTIATKRKQRRLILPFLVDVNAIILDRNGGNDEVGAAVGLASRMDSREGSFDEFSSFARCYVNSTCDNHLHFLGLLMAHSRRRLSGVARRGDHRLNNIIFLFLRAQ
jgi:hypothetical protein